MSWKGHRRSNLSVQAILTILEEEGLEASACMEGSGVSAADVLSVDTKISDAQEIEITTRALDMLPNKAGYGIRAGKALRITTFGVWGLAILASPNFREAFQIITRFADLSFLLSRVTLVERGDVAELVVDMDHLPRSIHRFVFERYYAASATFLREMLPDIDLNRFALHLPFSDARYETELARITGRQIVSDQSGYAMAADLDWLDQPLPQADPLTHAHFVGQCQALLNDHNQLPDFSQRVRDFIVRSTDYAPKLEHVSAEAGLSARSFRRKLESEGTTFTQLVADTRMALAKELLTTTGLSVGAVAARVGYSETSSFSRAFTHHWGQSPSQVRTSTRR